jgi:dihydrofolate reductase
MLPRTQYFAATSIDGFLAAEDDGLEWLLQFDFAQFQGRYDEFVAGIGSIVMGARSYEFIVASGDETAWPYGDTPCFVLAHHDHPIPVGANVTFVHGDIQAAHRSAIEAAAGRNVWLLGGGDVAAQLATRGLIDDLIVTVVPVVLGSGKQLLPGVELTEPLRLVDTHRFASGAVELRYSLT